MKQIIESSSDEIIEIKNENKDQDFLKEAKYDFVIFLLNIQIIQTNL